MLCACSLTLKSLSLLILIYFLLYELRSAYIEGALSYFSCMWNFFDIFFIATYTIILIFVIGEVNKEEIDKDHVDRLRVLYCILTLFIFTKITFFLRIYDGFSFLVSMLSEVFMDLRYFLALFVLVILTCAEIFFILQLDSGIYGDVGNFGYTIMSYRTSLGDFDLETFKSQDGLLLLVAWISWFIAVFVSQIVLMNFIIAVISESYQKVM